MSGRHTDVAAVQGRPSSVRGGGVTQLVIDNQVDAPTNPEVREGRARDRLQNNPLTTEGSITVHLKTVTRMEEGD